MFVFGIAKVLYPGSTLPLASNPSGRPPFDLPPLIPSPPGAAVGLVGSVPGGTAAAELGSAVLPAGLAVDAGVLPVLDAFGGVVPFGLVVLLGLVELVGPLALGSAGLPLFLLWSSGPLFRGSSLFGGINLAASPPAYLNHPSPRRKSKTGIAINAASVSAWSKVAIFVMYLSVCKLLSDGDVDTGT